jgi:hypothetical protein
VVRIESVLMVEASYENLFGYLTFEKSFQDLRRESLFLKLLQTYHRLPNQESRNLSIRDQEGGSQLFDHVKVSPTSGISIRSYQK